MEKLIKKYIDRIKIDYPEDDKLMIDLQDFYKEAQRQVFILYPISGNKPMVDELKALHKAIEKQKGMDSNEIL